MAETSVTPERVKSLFSSFVGTVPKQTLDTTFETPEPAELEKGSVEVKDNPGTEVSSVFQDRKAYYDRIETYSSLSWFAKPDELSPLVCARYGWENVDADLLQCVGCRSFLCGTLPSAVETQVYRESCVKLKENLVASHDKLCPWSNNPCPETFMLVPYHNRQELQSEYKERLTSLNTATSRLPPVTRSSFQTQGLNDVKLQNFYNEVKTGLTEEQRAVSTLDACLYALCGWSFCKELYIDVLICNYCRRRVGMWTYAQSDSDATNGHSHTTETTAVDKGSGDRDEQTGEPSSKRTKLNEKSFDPVSQHRYWCPWLQTVPHTCTPTKRDKTSNEHSDTSPTTSSSAAESPPKAGTAGRPAWLVVANMLIQDSLTEDEEAISVQMKMSPRVEGLRCLRRVLKDCASPDVVKKLEVSSQEQTPTADESS